MMYILGVSNAGEVCLDVERLGADLLEILRDGTAVHLPSPKGQAMDRYTGLIVGSIAASPTADVLRWYGHAGT